MTFDLWPNVMEAYKELSQEIGDLKRLKDLQYVEPGGSKPSHAGKMKTRSPGSQTKRHSHSDILGKEYLGESLYCLWCQLGKVEALLSV